LRVCWIFGKVSLMRWTWGVHCEAGKTGKSMYNQTFLWLFTFSGDDVLL
jgi:hypothetical protein